MYRPINVKFSETPTSALSTMPSSGINNLISPQFLDPKYALSIQNYEIVDNGALAKRKGFTKILEVAGDNPITLLKEWTTDVWIFGYATTIARYTVSTDTVTNIKTDFSANTGFDGVRYGNYFYVCNGVDRIWYITLATFAIVQIGASPAETAVLSAIGPRLYAGYEDTIRYSEVDVGGTPPFTAWSNATTATAGGLVYYRNAGTVRSIVSLGSYIVGFCDRGFFAFETVTFDSAGVISKTDNVVNYTEDFGGARGAILTEKGLFYANEAGFWNLVSIGQSGEPYSRQYSIISRNLGNTYFDNVDVSNGSIHYDRKKETLYFSCAKGSETNNIVISCNLKGKEPAFAKITNWNISRFMESDGVMYGASDQKTIVYKLFDGYTDDGQIIGTDYYQELNLGNLETRQMLKGVYVQGWLSASSQIKVRFDVYNVNGKLVDDKLKYLWEAQYSVPAMDAYNSSTYNRSTYNGDIDTPGLVESFDGGKQFIRNFQRIRVHFTSSDKFMHILTWVKLDARIKSQIRRRKLTKLS